MLSLNLGGQPAPLRLPMSPIGLPPVTLSRMGTVSSTKSNSVDSGQMRSPLASSPSSPFSKPRFVVAAFTTGAYEMEAPDMTSTQAKSEIARRIEKREIPSSKKLLQARQSRLAFL